jgi:FkbH-like protein
MRVDNRGSIVIGDALVVSSSFVPVELLTGPSGRLELGNHVWINFGSVIAAASQVKIHEGVMIGQHCIISDVEIPEALDGDPAQAKPIEIGQGAWLAGRVTVRPGVKIGKNAVITAGSIVESDVPDGVVAGGTPARVLRFSTPGDRSMPSVQNPAPDAGEPTSIANGAARVAEGKASAPQISGTIVSDFTADELVDELRVSDVHAGVAARMAPFGQVTQVLLEQPSADAADFLVVWTRPDATLPSFTRALAFEDVDESELLAEVESFCSLVEGAAARYKFVFVPTWVLPSWVRGLGMLDAAKGGITRLLLAANLRLCDSLARSNNVFVLNAERWFLAAGTSSAAPKGWYLGKVAAPRAVMTEAAADIKAALHGLRGGARKLLVLDLDDTMWGGIVGDVGWEGLRLGGHDGVGEALVDFQRAIKNLKKRGVVLGIVSKNEESVALEAIRNHPEMLLREEDFVGWKINWKDKAQNIAELVSELNLGLQSVVFIDDNPVERARVREALPEVFVPEWPVDKLLYPSAFAKLRCFDTPALSREDRDRTRMYAEERQRDQLQKQVGSVADWLKSLQMKVRVERLGPSNLARATQLLNKTNQLNLATRRMTEAELLDWASDPRRHFWTVSVADRFGDAGLTGLVSTERDGDTLRVVDYVLSCRVMGRKVEETMVHLAVETARRQSVSVVVAEYQPTPKNKPCLTFWHSSGFSNDADRLFRWQASSEYPLPDPIQLEWQPP